MWLFTQYGFYSVVQHEENPEAFLMRARVKNDLENLLKLTQIETPISHTPRAQYAFRVLLSQAEWNRIAQVLTRAVDYPSFTNRISELPDQSTKNAAYGSIWNALENVVQPSAAQIENEANTLRKGVLPLPGDEQEDPVWALFKEAEALMENGEIAQAVERADFLIARVPDFPMSYILKGFALSKFLDRHDEAVEILREGLRLLPQHNGAWRMLAISLIRADRADEAVQVLAEICEREPDALDARQMQGFAFAVAKGLRIPMPFTEWLDTHDLKQIDLQDGAALYLIGLHFLCAGLKDEAGGYVATVRAQDEAWADALQRAVDGNFIAAADDTPHWEKDNAPLMDAMARFGERPQGEGLEIIVRALQSGWAALLSDEGEESDEGTSFSLRMGPLPQLNGAVGLAAFTSRESSRRFVGDMVVTRIVQGGDSVIDLALQTHAATGTPAAIVLDPGGPQTCVLPIAALLEFQQNSEIAAPPFIVDSERKARTHAILENRGLLQNGDELELFKLPKKDLVLPDAARRATYLGGGKARWHFDGNEYSLSALCAEIVRQFGNVETPSAFRGPDFWAKSGSQISLTQLASS